MEVSQPERPPYHLEGQKLLEAIQKNLPELQDRLEKVNGHWQGEDSFYRYYHKSLKVYYLQKHTENILKSINKVKEDADVKTLDPQFLEIIKGGTNKTFNIDHNEDWGHHTRPILEAFFHAREMLLYMVKYAKTLKRAPNHLPSGWAAVLYLFNLR